MKILKIKWDFEEKGMWLSFYIENEKKGMQTVEKVLTSKVPLFLKVEKEKKSKTQRANAYLWSLCQEIAVENSKSLGNDKPITKEEVYRKAIREVGIFELGEFSTKDADRVSQMWEKMGIGWFADKGTDIGGKTELMLYKGSSVYNGEEFGRLLDNVVADAQELGIDTTKAKEIKKKLKKD